MKYNFCFKIVYNFLRDKIYMKRNKFIEIGNSNINWYQWQRCYVLLEFNKMKY